MLRRSALVVLRREYRARVRTRAFWISTFLFPLLLAAILGLPVLALSQSATRHRLVVVDETGAVAPLLSKQLGEKRKGELSAALRFEVVVQDPSLDGPAQRRALDARVLREEIDAWLWISREGLAHDRVEYRAAAVSNLLTQQLLEVKLSAAIRKARLEQAGYDEAQIGPLIRSVELATVRISETGSRAQGGQAQFLLAYVLSFLLYAILAIYGVQVMQGVLDEKNSHVVELLLSSVRPFDLMMGKLFGIGLVGLTQLAIWIGMLASLTALVGGGALDPIRPGLALPVLDAAIVTHFFALFVVGYFLYASFYAAIGAASNNLQEAQQFAFAAVLVLLASFMLFLPVVNDPDSNLAVAASLIPLFSPLIMMLRITVQTPPTWQILMAYGIDLAFIVFMVWACGRIYRIGILLHGKKPTLRALWNWVRST